MEQTILCILVLFTASYFVTAFLWGIYAIAQQKKHYHKTTSFLKYFLVFITNIIFMPVCIMIATDKLLKG